MDVCIYMYDNNDGNIYREIAGVGLAPVMRCTKTSQSEVTNYVLSIRLTTLLNLQLKGSE